MAMIEARMPVVAAQAGIWAGEYVHFDADHREIDRHASRLVCRLFDGPDGAARLTQTNIYDWADGSREIRYFDGTLHGDRILIRNETIDGWVAPLREDATGRTIMVAWVSMIDPSLRYYEMITLAQDMRHKNRVWHWYRDGALFQRTLINERKISDDWREDDDPSYYGYSPRSSR